MAGDTSCRTLSIPVDRGVSGDLRSEGLRLLCRWFKCDVDGPFEQLAFMEDGASPDERDITPTEPSDSTATEVA